MFVSSFICNAFSSKKIVLKFLMLSCGIGFRIRPILVDVSGVCLASSMLGGMFKVTGEWSEFRS